MSKYNIASQRLRPAGSAGTPVSADRPAAATMAGPIDMASSYDTYFNSGLYHARYPRPNQRTMRLLTQALPIGGRLLDYGAGEGRYCLNLAAMRGVETVATDISSAARDRLLHSARALGLAHRIQVCAPGDAVYRTEVTDRGGFDVVFLGFGVLGHVEGRQRRVDLLSELRSALAPSGRLILGLPNAARRFRAAQARFRPHVASGHVEPGDIYYVRSSNAGAVPLFYHLFQRAEIERDLAQAGYAVERLTSESMLPESTVIHWRMLGLLDDLASGFLPVGWGYGYLVVARAGL